MDLADLLGILRYGRPTSEKEADAARGVLPGAPKDTSADLTRANRYAAGYYFGQTHPTLAPIVQPFVDLIKTSNLPLLGGASPEEQSYASAGVSEGMKGQPQPDLAKALLALLRGR